MLCIRKSKRKFDLAKKMCFIKKKRKRDDYYQEKIHFQAMNLDFLSEHQSKFGVNGFTEQRSLMSRKLHGY